MGVRDVQFQPASDRCELFERIIGGVTQADFFRDFWNIRYLHLPRTDRAYYNDLVTVGDFNNLLSNLATPLNTISIYQEQRFVEPSAYTTTINSSGKPVRVLDAARVLALYRDGATIFFEDLSFVLPKLSVFRSQIQSFFSHPTQIGAFITPPGSRTLPTHCDRYDLFVLQIGGTKTWRLYESAKELPTRDFDLARYYEEYPRGSCVETIDLKSGDLLYLPRGCYHDAATTSEFSIHLNLAFDCYTWGDLLRARFSSLQDASVQFRRALPIGFARQLGKESFRENINATFRESISSCINAESCLNALCGLAITFARENCCSPVSLDLDAPFIRSSEANRFQRVRGIALAFEVLDETLKLVCNGRELKLPAAARAAALYALGRDEFALEDEGIPADVDCDILKAIAVQFVSYGILTAISLAPN